MNSKGWIAGIITVFTVIVAFFQLADSPTFRTYMWQPISERGINWSADDWSALGYNVFGLIGGVFLIVLVWRGLALRALGSYLWFLPPVFIMVLSFYRHAKWMGWW
jgi:hypothetical protein